MLHIILALMPLFFSSKVDASTLLEPEQLHIGNFALPPSQQPSTLYGFGQYVFDQGDLLAGCATSTEIGHAHNNFNSIFPYLIYGIRDDTVVLISLPIALQFNEGCHTSSGLLDATIEVEYLWYSYKTEVASWEISIEGALSLPFGSTRKNPATGFGSPAFFAGIITRYISTEWYWFVSVGGTFTTPRSNKNRFGHEFLYQTGFGKNVGYESDKWLCTVMLEMNGIYTQKDTVCGLLDPGTGGNLIALGPTVWFSTQRFIFQAGILPVVYQHWNGNQAKDTLFIDLNFAWKF